VRETAHPFANVVKRPQPAWNAVEKIEGARYAMTSFS